MRDKPVGAMYQEKIHGAILIILPLDAGLLHRNADYPSGNEITGSEGGIHLQQTLHGNSVLAGEAVEGIASVHHITAGTGMA